MLHKDWTSEQWKSVIESDEPLIKLDKYGCREHCIWKRNETFKLENCMLIFQLSLSYISTIVWICFTGNKLRPLVVCNARSIDSEVYSEILFDRLLSFVGNLLKVSNNATIHIATGSTLLLMHNNDPCYKLADVKELFKKANILVIKWPQHSSNPNWIKNLWPHVKKEFWKQFFEAEYHLSPSSKCILVCEKLLQEVWQRIGLDLIYSLIELISERCNTVITAGGGPTKFRFWFL